MRRIALAAVLAVTTSVAAAQTPTPPRRFDTPLHDLTPDLVRSLPAAQRGRVGDLHATCTAWNTANSRAEQDEIVSEATRMFSTWRDAHPWAGVLADRDVTNTAATARIMVGPMIYIETAQNGWLTTDPHDTRMPRGSRDYQAVASMRNGDLTAFRVQIIRPQFSLGRCSFLGRITRVTPL